MVAIVKSPNPLLNQVCEPCDPTEPGLRELAEEMAEAMYDNSGVGLAAPQIGVTKRIIVVDCTWDDDHRDPLVLINPELVETWGDPEIANEGCLSCPGISVPIERDPWARVRYYDFNGDLWEIESDGLLGRCLQHEIDHLNGRTLFESCSPRVRLEALKAYEEARRLGYAPGDTAIEVKVR